MTNNVTSPAPRVYAAISAVMAHMAKEGISKDRKNAQQGYNFRGIDDMYNALASVLAANKLMMLPYVQEMVREERQTKSGGNLNYTILTIDFKLVSAEDGSFDIVRVVGEAMDSVDKSSNKALSAGLKYAAMQVFMIPTEGDNDTDATTHDVTPRQQRQEPARDQNAALTPPDGWGDWTRAQIVAITGAATEDKLNVILDAMREQANALKAVEPMMYADLLKAFKARQAVLADQLPA